MFANKQRDNRSPLETSDDTRDLKPTLCRHSLKRRCLNGKNCPYLHLDDGVESDPEEGSEEPTSEHREREWRNEKAPYNGSSRRTTHGVDPDDDRSRRSYESRYDQDEETEQQSSRYREREWRNEKAPRNESSRRTSRDEDHDDNKKRHSQEKTYDGRNRGEKRKSPVQGSNKIVCTLYKLGKCLLGNACKDLHQSEKPRQEMKDLTCVYFVRGLCKRGDNCPYSHKATDIKKTIEANQVWLKFCKKYPLQSCDSSKCSYLHISHEDQALFKKSGLVSGNALGQAIRKALYFDIPLGKQSVCKEMLDGNCTIVNCPFLHCTRQEFMKKVAQELKEEFVKVFGASDCLFHSVEEQRKIIQKLLSPDSPAPTSVPATPHMMPPGYPGYPVPMPMMPGPFMHPPMPMMAPFPPVIPSMGFNVPPPVMQPMYPAVSPSVQLPVQQSEADDIDKVLIKKLQLANEQVSKENEKYRNYITTLKEENSKLQVVLNPNQPARELDDIRRRMLEVYDIVTDRSDVDLPIVKKSLDYQHGSGGADEEDTQEDEDIIKVVHEPMDKNAVAEVADDGDTYFEKNSFWIEEDAPPSDSDMSMSDDEKEKEKSPNEQIVTSDPQKFCRLLDDEENFIRWSLHFDSTSEEMSKRNIVRKILYYMKWTKFKPQSSAVTERRNAKRRINFTLPVVYLFELQRNHTKEVCNEYFSQFGKIVLCEYRGTDGYVMYEHMSIVDKILAIPGRLMVGGERLKVRRGFYCLFKTFRSLRKSPYYMKKTPALKVEDGSQNKEEEDNDKDDVNNSDDDNKDTSANENCEGLLQNIKDEDDDNKDDDNNDTTANENFEGVIQDKIDREIPLHLQERPHNPDDFRDPFEEREEKRFRKVYVGGLDEAITEDDFREYFREFGEITDIDIKRNRRGKLRGYGFVSFATEQEAIDVVTVDNHTIKGIPVIVRQAKIHFRKYYKVRRYKQIDPKTERTEIMHGGRTAARLRYFAKNKVKEILHLKRQIKLDKIRAGITDSDDEPAAADAPDDLLATPETQEDAPATPELDEAHEETSEIDEADDGNNGMEDELIYDFEDL